MHGRIYIFYQGQIQKNYKMLWWLKYFYLHQGGTQTSKRKAIWVGSNFIYFTAHQNAFKEKKTKAKNNKQLA